jgi:hypothetical protein
MPPSGKYLGRIGIALVADISLKLERKTKNH